MRKDKLISFRVPEVVYDEIRSLARMQGVTVSQLMKDKVVSASWRIELGRNRTYHKAVLSSLREIEERLRLTEKVGKEKPAMVGTRKPVKSLSRVKPVGKPASRKRKKRAVNR